MLNESEKEGLSALLHFLAKQDPECSKKLEKEFHARFLYYKPEFETQFGLDLTDYWVDDIEGFDMTKFINWLHDNFIDQIRLEGGFNPSELVNDKFGPEADELINDLAEMPVCLD
jgi:ribonucleotide reductase beta subunit family protein with ferritin-like domain